MEIRLPEGNRMHAIVPLELYSVAALDRTTQGSKEKIEYHQPGGPQATVPALPPLTSRMLDPEDSNEVSRQEALPDLLSSLHLTSSIHVTIPIMKS